MAPPVHRTDGATQSILDCRLDLLAVVGVVLWPQGFWLATGITGWQSPTRPPGPVLQAADPQPAQCVFTGGRHPVCCYSYGLPTTTRWWTALSSMSEMRFPFYDESHLRRNDTILHLPLPRRAACHNGDVRRRPPLEPCCRASAV